MKSTKTNARGFATANPWAVSLKLMAFALAAVIGFGMMACDGDGNRDQDDPFDGGDAPVALSGNVTIPTFIRVNNAVSANVSGLNATSGLTYRWQISNSAGGTWADIPAATGSSYTPVAADETKYIRVVVSAADYTGSVNSNAVLVRDESAEEPEVTGVSITDYPTSMTKGASNSNFSADVTGNNLEGSDYDVTWSVSGNSNSGTKFEGNTLYIALDETASNITVKATSVLDSGKSDTKNITITTPGDSHELTITGLSEWNGGTALVYIINNSGYDLALGDADITGNQVTIKLMQIYSYPPIGWNESGLYAIQLQLETSDGMVYKQYIYTDGIAIKDLGVASYNELLNKVKFNFTGSGSSIALDKFVENENPQDIYYDVNIDGMSGGNINADRSSSNPGLGVTLTITPDSGNRLDTLTVKDAADKDVPVIGLGNNRTFNMPPSDVTISATFVPLPANTIAVQFTGFADENINLIGNSGNDLSRDRNDELHIEVTGHYDYYQWFEDGDNRSGWDRYNTYANLHSVGLHTITVIVWKGDMAYSKEVTFRVVY